MAHATGQLSPLTTNRAKHSQINILKKKILVIVIFLTSRVCKVAASPGLGNTDPQSWGQCRVSEGPLSLSAQNTITN